MVLRATIRQHETFRRRTSHVLEDMDEALLKQAEVGDTLAFERIAWRYDEVILGFLLMLTSSEQEAIDLCRATFVAAYKDLAQRNTDSLFVWLYRLAAAQWLARRHDKHAWRPTRNELSAREQLVFTLRAGQRVALRTIAQILDLPPDVVAETFCHAIGKLRAKARQERSC